MEPIKVIVIGAGSRGHSYTKLMAQMPEAYQVVAVADPDKARTQRIRELCDLPEDACYGSWEEILSKGKIADLAVIATLDQMHYEPTMKAIELGYDLLLEKPVAQTAQECADIALAAEKKGVKVIVCHVLRYTPFFNRVKSLLMEDTIGRVLSMIHVEAVGNVHQSHSYVRGNWHSQEETTPMLLAKSCHDMDIIQWLLDKPCKKIQSFGDLTYFTKENAPEGAPVRCADGGCPVAQTCPYNCMKLYYEDKDNSWFRGAATRGLTAGTVPTDEEVLHALKTTDYGLCVFHANNDVVDHQVVNMEFDGGATVSFTMNAFNKGGRYVRIFGTKGELYANMSDEQITVYTFADKQVRQVPVSKTEQSITGGHGGGDAGIVRELYAYLTGSYNGVSVADITRSVKNHFIGFAAEQARQEGRVVDMDAFFGQYSFVND